MGRIYFAYGSNMNPSQMKHRCPDSRALAKAKICGYRLAINARGVATIVPDETSSVFGVLWKISKTDEFKLDHFEGVQSGKYEKKKMRISVGKDSASALVYVDCISDAGTPREGYIEKIISAQSFSDSDTNTFRIWKGSHMRKKHFVAVYGTLKNGKQNHSLMTLIRAEFVGAAKTIEKYPLICGGGLPYLFENVGVGHRVDAEVYKVDDEGLKILDRFEGHPNFYIRKHCECEIQNGEKRVCFIYFIKKKRTDFGGFIMQKKLLNKSLIILAIRKL